MLEPLAVPPPPSSLANSDSAFPRAVELAMSDRASEALQHALALAARDPDHLGARALAIDLSITLGREDAVMLHLARLFEAAEEEVVAAVDGLPRPWSTVAGLAHRLARPSLARGLLDRVLECWPDCVEAMDLLAAIVADAGDPGTGAALYRRAVALRPEDLERRANLGRTLIRTGDLDGALAAYDEIIDLDADHGDALRQAIAIVEAMDRLELLRRYFLGLVDRIREDRLALFHVSLALLSHEFPQEALAGFVRVLELWPETWEAKIGAAAAALRLGQPKVAEDAWIEAIQEMSDDPDEHLMVVRSFMNVVPSAVLRLILTRSRTLIGGNALALARLGLVARELSQGELAVAALEAALALDPGLAEVRSALLEARLSLCDWAESQELIEDTIAETRRAVAVGGTLDIDVWNLFAIGADYRDVAGAARLKSRQVADRVAAAREEAGFRFERRAGGKLRLGYLCPYTWESSHVANLRTVVSRHDRHLHEVFGYSVKKWTDAPSDRAFRDLFDGFKVTPSDDPLGSARAIREDGIDILIDTTGHFAIHCMDLAAMRPAPIVVHGCAGHNIIGAAEFYDYSLNDARYLPDEFHELYVERPCFLPHTAMPAELLEIGDPALGRAELDLPEEGLLFANFNHPCKYDPRIFEAWMEILRRVDGSRLVLGSWVGGTRERLLAHAERKGIGPERLHFARLISRTLHLRRLQLCDLALDTFYHCGGVTTIDCLIAGLPIITARPDRALPLVNLSLLTALGLEDLVEDTLADYVETAVALAGDPARLAALRERLWRNRGTHPLFQTERWVANLERAYAVMYQVWLDGHEPAPFEVLDVQRWPHSP